MARQILLTQGQFAIVDDEDFDRLNQHKWYARWAEATQSFYAVRNPNIYMHQEVLNAQKGAEVDHVCPEETLINSRCNLRFATHLENCRNRGIRASNTSGFKGVSWHTKLKKWRARISPAPGKILSLGLFAADRKEEAARAYDRAAIQHHGEFARLNFSREDYA
jgi:hypothetical protein